MLLRWLNEMMHAQYLVEGYFIINKPLSFTPVYSIII